MVQIAVTGQSETRHAPERGSVVIRVEATGADRPDVVARVARQHAHLVAQAREHVDSGAADTFSTGDVTTGTHDEWVEVNGKQQRVRRFRAQARVHVTFSDFGALGAWCLDVAAGEDVAVEQVSWDLTDETRAAAREALLVGATQDAAARAATYAAALGLGAPRPTAVFDDGLRPGSGSGGGGPTPLRAMRAMAFDAGEPTLELQPKDIELAVVISADFEA